MSRDSKRSHIISLHSEIIGGLLVLLGQLPKNCLDKGLNQRMDEGNGKALDH
jgi:hypothetical protein